MLREMAVEAGGVTLNVAHATEDGPPLVLLHGVTGRWQGWLPVIPDLAVRWRLLAPDLRGHGRSGRAGGDYRVTDYAADIVALLRQRAGEPAVVVGHSLGAIIAIAVAADAPELVRAIVLEDPPLAAFGRERLRDRPEYAGFTVARDLARSGEGEEAVRAALTAQFPSLDAVTLRARARAIAQLDPDVLTLILEDRAKEGYDLDRRLRAIGCPALLMQGNPALGGALADRDADAAIALLAQGDLVRLPDVGHGIHATSGQPATFCRLVHDFLESL